MEGYEGLNKSRELRLKGDDGCSWNCASWIMLDHPRRFFFSRLHAKKALRNPPLRKGCHFHCVCYKNRWSVHCVAVFAWNLTSLLWVILPFKTSWKTVGVATLCVKQCQAGDLASPSRWGDVRLTFRREAGPGRENAPERRSAENNSESHIV